MESRQDLGAHPGNGNRRSASRSFFRGRGGRYPANFLLDTMACDDIAYDDRIPFYGADPLSAAQSNAEPFGPLTPSMIHVLLPLAGHHLHGYAIPQERQLRTGGTVRRSPGTLH